MQEQQLKARQLVLTQQAASAVAAASKTQREVYVGNLTAGMVTADTLRQLFNSTMAAAFPDMAEAGVLDAVAGWAAGGGGPGQKPGPLRLLRLLRLLLLLPPRLRLPTSNPRALCSARPMLYAHTIYVCPHLLQGWTRW